MSLRIMYVPLDSRPVNTDRVRLLAEASNIQLVMPTSQSQIGGNPLDPNNEFGNPDAIVRWIDNQSGHFDGFILSIDMIAYGGLMPSRKLLYTAYEMNTAINSAIERLKVIDRLKSRYPNRPIFLFDTVMRLATNTYVGGLDINKYSNFRTMMRQPRKVVTNSRYTIMDNYHIAPNGSTINPSTYGLTQYEVDAYYRTRRLNLEINYHAINKVRNKQADFIVFGVDDASDQGVQLNEIEYLKGRINEYFGASNGQNANYGMIIPDADGLGMALLGKIKSRLHGGMSNGATAKYSISYFGTHGSNIRNAFEYINMHENLLLHIQLVGGQVVSRSQADMDIIVYTPNGSSSSVVSQITSNHNSGIPTIVMDMVGGATLPEAILNSTYGAWLMSYSAWNTAGNKMGIALGHANARYVHLKFPNANTTVQDNAQAKLLFLEFIKDYAYFWKVRANLRDYIERLAGDSNAEHNFNLYSYNGNKSLTSSQINELVNKLRNDMKTHVNYVAQRINGKKVICRVFGQRSFWHRQYTISSTQINNTINSMNYPWDRLFEITIEPQATVIG